MTLPQPDAPRKRRGLGIDTPFVLLLIAAVVYSGVWFWLRAEAGRRLDQLAAQLGTHGYSMTWDSRSIGGYPFRLDADFRNLTLREPSGWSIAFPRLRSETFVYAPTHFVAEAPDGAVFTRPVEGAVRVQAQALRASLVGVTDNPPRLSIEGRALTFTPAPGAQPYFLTRADNLQVQLRRGPDDQGGAFLLVEGARAQADGLIGQIARQGPVGLRADLIYTRAASLIGPDWPSAVRNWVAAGGSATLRQGGITAGEAILSLATSQPLTVGPDGRLLGGLSATLRQAPQVLAAAGARGAIEPNTAAAAGAVLAAGRNGESARLNLEFRAGQTTLGPVAIAPAPRIY